MMNITVLFKSGKEVNFQCRDIAMVRDWAGDIVGWETAGVTAGANILHVDFTEVACVYERKEISDVDD